MDGVNLPSVSGSLQRGASQRAAYFRHVDSVTGKVSTFYGYLDVPGAGEALVDIEFPATFIELPCIAGPGYILKPNQSLPAGGFPQVTVGLASLTTIKRATDVVLYTGGQLALTVDGPSVLPMTVTFQLMGIALTNPIRDL